MGTLHTKGRGEGFWHVQLFLVVCILLKTIPDASCSHSHDDDAEESSCDNLSNTVQGSFTCTDGNAHGSTCNFHCTRSGYTFCPGCPIRWTCNDGSWGERVTPTCCDTSPPTLTCPRSITTYADPNDVSTVVSWETPLVSDNSGALVQPDLISGNASGSTFDEGRHSIKYQACDAKGNTAECSFTVTVIVNRCETLTAASQQFMSCSNEQDNFIYGSRCSFSCASGSCLDGSGSIHCLNSGTSLEPDVNWSGEQPTCKAVQCPSLSRPANGYLYAGSCSDTYGSDCWFGCNSGYAMVGDSNRRCIAQSDGSCLGVWTGKQLECRVSDFEPPVFNVPDRIVVYAEENSLAAEIDYSWEQGMATDAVSGDITATLISVGGVPLANGGGRPSSLYEGVHRLVYEATDVAGNVAFFTLELVVEVIRCNLIQRPQFVVISCTHSTPLLGSRCSCSCPTGLCINEASQMVCENTGNSTHPVGTWSDGPPTCQFVTCPVLSAPLNGHFVNGPCTNIYGDICELGCDAVFSLASGDTIRQCLAFPGAVCNEGYWSGQQPECEEAAAAIPPVFLLPLRTIHLLSERQETYAILDYTRWEPVHAIDDESGVIVANLVRVDSQPISADLKPTTLSEGPHILEYEAEDEDGNKASETMEVVVGVARCPQLPGSFDSILCSHQDIYGSTCTFSCGIDKCLTGRTTLTCICIGDPYQPRGEWSYPFPTCQPSHCAEFTPPSNGYLMDGSCSPTNGSTCHVACNEGYSFQDDLDVRPVQCHVDEGDGCTGGHWSGSSVCLDFEPPLFTRPENLIETVTAEPRDTDVVVDYSWEPVMAFDTASGQLIAYLISIDSVPLSDGTKPSEYTEGSYTLMYEAEDENGNKAMWSMQLNVRVIRCSNPPSIDNGQITCLSDDNILGTYCVIQCNYGYCVEGSDWLTMCSISSVPGVGEWSVANPSCREPRCPDLLPPINGYIVSGAPHCSGIIGTQCDMACNADYQVVGDDVRHCQVQLDGSCDENVWSGQKLQCRVPTCPSLVAVSPTFHTGTGCNTVPGTDVVGTSCQWHCPPGYRSIGSDVSTCLHDGTWDNMDFTCESITCPALVGPQDIEFIPESCGTQSSLTGVSCQFRCTTRGFDLRDSDGNIAEDSLLACSEDGQWSPNDDISSFYCHDTERPQFTECPDSHTTLYASRSMLSSFVGWTVDAIDNSEQDPTVTCNMTEGMRPEGVYNIHCTATDVTGNEATCSVAITVRVHRCQPTVPVLPPHGSVDVRYTCDNYYGGNCSILCEEGYELLGSNQALCEYDADTGHTYWSWNEQPTCQSTAATNCNPLPYNESSVSLHCTQSNSVGSICTFYCPRTGYILRGVSGPIVCQTDNSWNEDVSLLHPRCKDNQPPTIYQCPSEEIHGELSPITLRAEIQYDVPQASDNSQQAPRVEKTPTNITSPYFFSTDTLISYKFLDEAGNSDTCSFQVVIQNNLPPTTVDCPRSEELQFDSPNDVAWQLPQFVNPVTGAAIIPICNRQPGDDLQPGEHTITCTATNPDNSISNQCVFDITVGDNLPCDPYPLHTPSKGIWNCLENVCTLTCDAGFDVGYRQPTVFTCGNNGWIPPPEQIPSCRSNTPPKLNGLTQQTDVTLTSNIDCHGEALQVFLQNEVTRFVETSSDGETCSGMCTVNSVEVICQAADPLTRRKRRETADFRIGLCIMLGVGLNETATNDDINYDTNAMTSLGDKIKNEFEEGKFHPNVAGMVVEPDDGHPVTVGNIVPSCVNPGLTPAKNSCTCITCETPCEP